MNTLTKFFTLLLLVVLLTGCQVPNTRDPSTLDALIDVASALTVANTTSAPVNPYTVPVGIGLAGLTAMLEALRRKERAGRKHAEHKLNGSTNGK